MAKRKTTKVLALVANGDTGFDARTKINAGLTLTGDLESRIDGKADVTYVDSKVSEKVNKAGDTLTGTLQMIGDGLQYALKNTANTHGMRMVMSGDRGYYQAGTLNDPDTTGSHQMALSGYMGKGLTDFRVYMKEGVTPIVDWPSGDKKFYHQGFNPTAADVGAVAKTGDTMTGMLQLHGGSSQLRIYDTDEPRTWDIEINSGNLNFVDVDNQSIAFFMGSSYIGGNKPFLCHAAQSSDPAALTRKDYVDGKFLGSQEAIHGSTLDWNTLTYQGVYQYGAEGNVFGPNGPSGIYGYGQIVVTTAQNTVVQIYYPHSSPMKVAMRFLFGTAWVPWTYFQGAATTTELDRINELEARLEALEGGSNVKTRKR